MPDNHIERQWQQYREQELAAAKPILNDLGFELDTHQPHIGGERYLMQAVTTTSGKKLILLGHRRSDGARVVIKVSSDPDGVREIEHERLCRTVLHTIKFAYRVFRSPAEILFEKHGAHRIFIQEYIEQDKPFLEYDTPQQFTLALDAFKAQEGARATTYSHIRLVTKTFGSADAETYTRLFSSFKTKGIDHAPFQENLPQLMRAVEEFLTAHIVTINRYGGFLTHTDFVPHNFRISGKNIYLLDHSSLRFGNKYEGWARFLNFMTLYNPELEEALMRYVKDNRVEEELLSLRLMRAYRLAELIYYHARAFANSSGWLHALSRERVAFWTHVLSSLLNEKPLPEQVREAYKKQRDTLRNTEEEERQKHLF